MAAFPPLRGGSVWWVPLLVLILILSSMTAPRPVYAHDDGPTVAHVQNSGDDLYAALSNNTITEIIISGNVGPSPMWARAPPFTIARTVMVKSSDDVWVGII